MYTDIHCHLLSEIDDGASDVETSIQMLQENKRQGVDKIILTPHYYSDCSIDEFLAKRNNAVIKLRKEMAKTNSELEISVLLGAEVYYRPSLIEQEDIKKLCIGGAKYLLLEMPFAKWDRKALNDIDIMINSFGITPIMAHIERYLPYNDDSVIDALLQKNVLVQMNAGFLLSKKNTKKAKSMIKDGMIDFLASDCHNLDSRPQNLQAAFQLLEDSKMQTFAETLESNATAFFS